MLFVLRYILKKLNAIEKQEKKLSVDLSAQFANLDAAIAALPQRVADAVAAGQANAIQPSDVQSAADARAAQVNAIAPEPVAPAPPAA